MKKIIIYAAAALLIFVASVAIYCYFNFQLAHVPTGAMSNTILPGDMLWANKNLKQINRGDIIVFKYPKDPSVKYVKRVIGLPGETIQIKGNLVFINGKELPERRLIANLELDEQDMPDSNASLKVIKVEDKEGAKYSVFCSDESKEVDSDPEEMPLDGRKYAVREPYKIPAGQYFVMGDNRDNSQDSRYWGTVSKELIESKPTMILWSNYKNSKGEIVNREGRAFIKLQ